MLNLTSIENKAIASLAHNALNSEQDKEFEKAFLVGADMNQEDILFWWISNARKYSPQTPIQVVDFGLSDFAKQKLKKQVDVILSVDKFQNKTTWFNKPRAMLTTKAKTTLWVDIDCEILSDISDVFDLVEINKIGLVNDQFYCEQGSPQYNTGVVLYKNKPKILYAWDSMIQKSSERGDQEVLKTYLDDHPYIKKTETYELPDKYNCVRLFYLTHASGIEDLRVIHWTGPKGKKIIRGPKKMGKAASGGTTTLGHDWNGDENQYKPKKKEDIN